MKNFILLLSIIGILSACSNDDSEIDTQEFVPGEVLVGIKSGTNINETFNFINQFDHKVNDIHSLTFVSALPADSLQYVLKSLNEKTYTNDGVNWFVSGYLNNQTNQITIFPKLFGMDNTQYQKDWLTSMKELRLSEEHNAELNSGIIHFNVPIGAELEWENRFKNYDLIDWAELNYYVDIELSKD